MTPRTHNITSYGVALIVLPAVVLARSRVSGAALGAPSVALPVALWTAHFARRAAEAAWLHRYSKPRFPLGDALIEYVYYWGFAAWIGWTLSAVPGATFGGHPWLGTATFALGELGNHRCHRMLSALRPAAGSERPIPRGFLFERVSCPHYSFEIISWVGFALVAPSFASLGFLLLGSGILGTWAWQRHADYRRRFDEASAAPYPRERRALIPFVF